MKRRELGMMKRKWGMVIDLDKCTGCGMCEVACMQENNMPIFEDDSNIPKRVSFLTLMKVTNDRENDLEYGDVKVVYIPKMCQQCENPSCVSVCPVTATDIGDDGVVSQIWSRCFGCRYCIAACPYEARVFNWWKPRYECTFKESLNPDVSIASRGTVVKCTFCSHIWKRERDKAVAKGITDINAVEYTPACVSACPTEAIVFGDLNDPTTRISKLIKSNRAFRLVHTVDEWEESKKQKLKKLYPEPKVYYLTSHEWIRKMMRF
ncbi:MAG: 4Fe-4S dicluster domain-containing protein [Spirochaetota bacterium]|nr:4Fe-4S dicluster domain-containing protein [Spirochaetota bacterium]